MQHFHLLLASVRPQDQTPTSISKGSIALKKNWLCSKNSQSLGGNTLIIITTLLCKHLTCCCFQGPRKCKENTPCTALECRATCHVVLGSTWSLAELWPEEMRPGQPIIRKYKPNAWRDSFLYRGSKCTSRNMSLSFQPKTTISSFSWFLSVISSFWSNIMKFHFEMNHYSNAH